MSSHHAPPSGFAGHSSNHQSGQQNPSLAQQQAFLAQQLQYQQQQQQNGGQQGQGYGSIPPHLLQQGFRQPQQQQQGGGGWPQQGAGGGDTSNGTSSFPPSSSSTSFNSPSTSHNQSFPNGMSPYSNYGTPQQQSHPSQAPHRSHSSLSQQSNAAPFMGSPSPYPQQQQQQNPSSSSSNNNAFPQQSQMLPPASTASPRPSSKRKHRASTGPGGATGSPLVANASVPSPAQQSRPNPMAMGGYDLSALTNGFPGQMSQQQQQQQLQAAFMAQRLQAQQQHLQQSQSQSSPGGFPNHQGSPYSNIPQQQRSSSSSSFPNPSPNGQIPGLPPSSSSSSNQNNHGRQSSSGLSLPPPNPNLPNFFEANSLPPQHRPYANNPAALQMIYKDQPNLLATIAKMMFASKRQGEGVPGMPGSAPDPTGRRTSFGQTPSGGGGGGAGGMGGAPGMVMPSKGRSSSSSSNNLNINHSTPTSAVLPPNFFPPGSLGRSGMQAPATPTPVSFNNANSHPSLGGLALLPPPPPPSRPIPTRPASPPEWTGSIHPSTLPTTFVQPLLPAKLEMTDPTFGGALPEITKKEIVHVQSWIEKDKKYLTQVAEQRQLIKEKLSKAGRGIGRKTEPGWWEGDGGKRRADWEGDRAGLESFGLVWPEAKKAKREERRGRKEVRFTKAEMKQVADKEEQLVPIRLEIDYDPFKFRDTFTWNASDPLVTPDMFAQTLIDDFHLPSHFRLKIVTAINDQVTEYKDLLARSTRSSALEGVMSTRGKLEEDEEKWWNKIKAEGKSLGRKAATAKVLANGVVAGGAGAGGGKGKGRVVDSDEEKDEEEDEAPKAERPMTVGELGPKSGTEFGHDEMRITIQIDITYGRVNLKDTFEWDANGPDSAVEEFAEVMAADLGLAGEFRTAIAHDIREQCFSYLKSLILVGHPFDGTAILDEELRLAFLPPVTTAIRTEDVSSSSFTPQLQELDDADIEKAEKEREKELRRKKRQTKGRRGVALPEREPNKTKRTIPSIGRPGPVDHSGLPIPAPGPPGTSMPAPPSPPVIVKTSRRAAALAASAHIASIAKEDFIDEYDNPSRRSPTPPPVERKREKSHQVAPTSSTSSNHHPHQPSSSQSSSTPYNNGFQHPQQAGHPTQNPYQQQQQQQASTPYSSTPLPNRSSNGHHPQQQQGQHPSYPPQQATNPYGQNFHPSQLQQNQSFDPLAASSSRQGGSQHALTPQQQQQQQQQQAQQHHQQQQHQHQQQQQQQQQQRDQQQRSQQAPPPPAPPAASSKAPTPPRPTTATSTRSRRGDTSAPPAPPTIERPRRGTRNSDAGLSSAQGTPDSSSRASGLVKGEESKTRSSQRASQNGSGAPSPSKQAADKDGGSPLSFHDVASPDSSSSELSATPGLQKDKELPSDDVPSVALPSPRSDKVSSSRKASGLPLTSPSLSVKASASPSVSTSSASGQQPPSWLTAAADALRRRYPDDNFSVVPKPRKSSEVRAPGAPAEWRIKCLDCPGKIYDPGPGPLLDNFTVHLNNRNHRTAVNTRKEKA